MRPCGRCGKMIIPAWKYCNKCEPWVRARIAAQKYREKKKLLRERAKKRYIKELNQHGN